MVAQPSTNLTGDAPPFAAPAYRTTLLLIGRLDEHRVALPVSTVERVLPMAALTQLPELPETVVGVLNLHGVVLPAVDPRPQLGVPTPRWHPDQRLVLLRARTRFLLWLDAVECIADAPVQQGTAAAIDAERALSLAMLDGESMPVLSPQALDPGLVFAPAGAPRQV